VASPDPERDSGAAVPPTDSLLLAFAPGALARSGRVVGRGRFRYAST